jgi:hypothetical protein
MLAVLLVSLASAAPCGSQALDNVISAEEIILNIEQVPLAEQANEAERALRLAQNALDASPRCRNAKRLRETAARTLTRVRPISAAAAQEELLSRLDRRLTMLEESHRPDARHVQMLSRTLSALRERNPDDERLAGFTFRLAMLGGSR